MSDPRIHNESSAGPDEDTDFVMRRCHVCDERAIGKSMSSCEECHRPICQSCEDDSVYMGCSEDRGQVCSICLEVKYHGRRKYCPIADCGCDNPSPKRKAKEKAEELVAARKDATFRANLNVEEWKKTHPPINFPSRYRNRYLVDIFLSDQEFERGYLNWLDKEAIHRLPNQTDEEYQNFQNYRKEAAELLTLYDLTKPAQSRYSLRKRDKSPKRQ
jgi:hypothetical protein